MGKTILLVPREEMLYQAHNILQERKYKIDEMHVIQTKDTVIEARKAIADGAGLIIARGLQASLIKQYTDIPVVEITMTAQEMGLLVIKAKQILKKDHPAIAVVGFKNMFCDMSFFEQLYDVELRTYLPQRADELEAAAKKAIEEQADLLIGGDIVVQVASECNIPSLFLSPTEDSMRNALAVAERMSYAMESERQKNAQMEVLLDSSFNGVVRMDADGNVMSVNSTMEELSGESKDQWIGQPVFQIFPEIDLKLFQRLSENNSESWSLPLKVGKRQAWAVLAPMLIEGRLDGYILTCSRFRHRSRQSQDNPRYTRFSGLIALGNFEDTLQKSSAMQRCIRKARMYAMSERAVLIQGEAGTERSLIAQCIHNSSARNQGPFGAFSCIGKGSQEQETAIFSAAGILHSLAGGTLLIDGIEEMTRNNQQKLAHMLRYKWYMEGEKFQKVIPDVRIIVSTECSLINQVKERGFSEELCYLLNGLILRLPPLRERKEDLKEKLEQSVKKYCEDYGRYHVVTSGAMELLLNYRWPGNLIQVEAFCEYLILTAQKRSIDQIQVREALLDLFGDIKIYSGKQEEATGYKDIWEQKIRSALEEHGGRRLETARALGISKSTLWRYLKKYGIS